MLIEQGRDLAYVEHWHRDAEVATEPAAGALLRDSLTGTQAMLVRVGSTLPYRIGDMLTLDQRWELVETEGDLAALSPPGGRRLPTRAGAENCC